MLRIRQLYIFHVSELFLLFFPRESYPKRICKQFPAGHFQKCNENKKNHQELLGLIREALLSLQSLRNYGPLGWVPWSQSGMVRTDPWGLNSHWISKWSWTWFRKDLYTHCKDSRKLKVGFFPLPNKTRLPWLLAHILHREKDSGHHLTQVKRLNSGNFCGCIYCAADNLSTWYHGSDSQPFREKNISSPHMWPLLIS